MGALPLELLGPPPLQPPLQPADEKRTERETESSGVTRLEGARLSKKPAAPSFSYLRACELEDIADGLLEHHYDGHLDEEVGKAAAGVTLQRGRKRAVMGRCV